LLTTIVEPGKIVVVAATEQILPTLPADMIVARDRVGDRGPLEGLLAGLETLHDQVDAAYVTSCDAPLLVPAFVERAFERLDDFDAVVPCAIEHCHPLSAVYRPSVIPAIRELLANQQFRLSSLLESVRTRRVSVEEFRDVDPELLTLMNLNRPEDYQTALKLAGLPFDEYSS
jgi:molybdopterin-guanine dinucleotide biosynthesis protein A